MSSIITLHAQTLAHYKDEIGWYRIPDTETISKETFFAVYGNELGLGTLDEMKLLECITDEFENEHCRYAQHYDGVGMEYTHFLRHSVGDKVYLAYGKLVNSENCTGSFALTEAEALSAALDYLAWDSYLWESSDAETALKEFMEDDNATYYPVGKKIWANTSLDGSAESYRPAYYFYISQTETNGLYVYVDAETSTIIKSFVPGVEEPLLFTNNNTQVLKAWEAVGRGVANQTPCIAFNNMTMTEINTQHISSGIYLAKLQLRDGTINTLKIAIQH